MSSIKIMTEFEEITLRLKNELNVTKDGDIAKFLGMTHTAFSERKKRNSFPSDRLIELVQGDQEKWGNMDLHWILTGEQINFSEEESTLSESQFKVMLEPAIHQLSMLSLEQQINIFELIANMYKEKKKTEYFKKLLQKNDSK